MSHLSKIKSWIDKHVPKTVKLKAGDERVLLSVYTYMQLPKPELVEAAERIQAQMPYWPAPQPPVGETFEYLLYEADKKALADMCNDYCILLSDAYQYYPGWAKELATDNYKRCTELFIQLQS